MVETPEIYPKTQGERVAMEAKGVKSSVAKASKRPELKRTRTKTRPLFPL